jgi:hypothetical protein
MIARNFSVPGSIALSVLATACSSTPSTSTPRLSPGLVAGVSQDQSYEIPGKPQAVDENETPSGVGFNQMGGEMNPYASESEAINKVNYHFHFYGGQPSGAPGSNAPAAATAPDGSEVPGPPGPSSPPAGYAPPVWSTPMALSNYGGGGGWGGGYHFHFYHGGYGMPASQGNATGAGAGWQGGYSQNRGAYDLPASQGNATGAGAGVAGGYNESGTNYNLPSSQGNAAGAGGGYGGGVNYHFHFYGPPAGNPGGFAP